MLENYILGTMNIKYPYSSNQDETVESYKEIIDFYVQNYKNPILDTAYYYGNTETEVILGDIIKDYDNVKIATKANPWFENDFTNGKYGQLSKDNLTRQLNTSLINLKKTEVGVEYFYLHCYDYETPLKETLETCDTLWRSEKFKNLGISNFSIDQMEDVMNICNENGYVIPKYYQGMYNILSRKVEEMSEFLDEFNIEFWGYNPLAGGLLTGKYSFSNIDDSYISSRFCEGNSVYRNIFWKEELLDTVHKFSNQGNCIKRSYEWLRYHSIMNKDDKIIMGVSTLDQLKYNTLCLNEKKLDIDIRFINKLYEKIEDISPNYYY